MNSNYVNSHIIKKGLQSITLLSTWNFKAKHGTCWYFISHLSTLPRKKLYEYIGIHAVNQLVRWNPNTLVLISEFPYLNFRSFPHIFFLWQSICYNDSFESWLINSLQSWAWKYTMSADSVNTLSASFNQSVILETTNIINIKRQKT